jgi:hypothetical protein
MQQIVLNIKDNSKREFFRELLKQLDFVEVVSVNEEPFEPNDLLEGLKASLVEVDAHLKGEIKLQTAKEFLDEL